MSIHTASPDDQTPGPEGPAETDSQELPGPRLIDWLLFLPYLLIFVFLLLSFDIIQRIVMPFSTRWQEEAVRILNVTIARSLRLLGIRLETVAAQDLPPDKPYIVVSNHQSMFDIPILFTYFGPHRLKFVAKRELAKWIPSLSVSLRNTGSAIIDRSNKTQAISEIQNLGQRMNEQKFAAVLFPEGTRARTGALKRFRSAGLSVLAETVPDAEVVPVVIEGSWKITIRRYGPFTGGHTVRLRIGKPLNRNEIGNDELVGAAHQAVRAMLAELRN